MKYPLIAVLSLTALTGCNEINHTKLGYQLRECVGDTTIRCNDLRIRFLIAETRLQRQSLEDNRDKAIAKIGQTNYERLLALFDQKIDHLKGQRHNIYFRWFQGDSQDYREIDRGYRIDAEIRALGDKIARDIDYAARPAQSATTSFPDEQKTAAQMITAEVTTADQANQSNTHPTITAGTGHIVTALAAMDMGEESVSLSTDQGTIVFHGNSLTIDQVDLLESLHSGDCLNIHTTEPLTENADGFI